MHGEAYLFLNGALRARVPKRVLDIGGADVNASLRGLDYRELLPPTCYYACVDKTPGPGVDLAADFCDVEWPAGMPKPDTIICAEVFEHCARLALFLQRAYEALAPGGLLVFTCAAPGRKPHGANGEPYLPPGEYYHNPTENELRVALRHFSEFHVIQFTKHADWFGVAWKGPGGA